MPRPAAIHARPCRAAGFLGVGIARFCLVRVDVGLIGVASIGARPVLPALLPRRDRRLCIFVFRPRGRLFCRACSRVFILIFIRVRIRLFTVVGALTRATVSARRFLAFRGVLGLRGRRLLCVRGRICVRRRRRLLGFARPSGVSGVTRRGGSCGRPIRGILLGPVGLAPCRLSSCIGGFASLTLGALRALRCVLCGTAVRGAVARTREITRYCPVESVFEGGLLGGGTCPHEAGGRRAAALLQKLRPVLAPGGGRVYNVRKVRRHSSLIHSCGFIVILRCKVAARSGGSSASQTDTRESSPASCASSSVTRRVSISS